MATATAASTTTRAARAGAAVKALREARQWSQEKLADAAQKILRRRTRCKAERGKRGAALDVSRVSRIERGDETSLERYEALAEALGVPLAALFVDARQ